ncbi:beta-mannosidase [Gloeopeniophorella convolvens]|nr:beta-mannosidase [Gloeopeniophorella convolvens]
MASVLRKLDKDWSFTQVGGGEGTKDGEWLETGTFPTTVHVELIRLKKIPDPFIGLHEWDVQWIGEADWEFKTTFEVSQQEADAPNIDLVFDGLDTFGTVVFNGYKLLETENQFVSYRTAVKEHLKVGTNELVIAFASAQLKGKDLEKKFGVHRATTANGDFSRTHVRKAQYHYGWDWGPVLLDVGPWRPVHLHTYHTRIADLWAAARVNAQLEPVLSVKFTLDAPGAARVLVKDAAGTAVRGQRDFARGNAGEVQFAFGEDEVELWYPVGYGKQPLYTIEVQAVDDQGNVRDTQTRRVGFRRVRVVEGELVDQPGLSWYFEVNNIPIFCGGSNWIPADSFLTTITPERYRAWLQLLIDGNQNMVRVWGGGIYEPDVFYETCDELGIMVWQDFAFACAQYPAYDEFLDNVRLEAEQNIKRLRHHASVVIIAGNNEDYEWAEKRKLELNYEDHDSDFRKTTFPGRHIYERVLPPIVAEHSDFFYHRSSPYSGHDRPTTDRTYGDLHQWNVWHGSQEPWHNWDILAGRFVSEFGMQAYPDIRTVDYWVGDNKAERHVQSRTTFNHDKAIGFERRLELYLMENFKHAFDMESYVYYTQIMQAEALSAAYRLWRRNWGGPGREYTSGALVWQLNDCWPVISWAIADYFLRPKPAYFAIARELQPYTVGATRKWDTTPADGRTLAHVTITSRLEIWGTNATLAPRAATLEVAAFDLARPAWRAGWTRAVALAPNASTELWRGEVPGQPARTRESEVPRDIVVGARLLDADGRVLARHANWPEPYKYIAFPTREEVALTVALRADGETLEVAAARPVKGVVLEVEGAEVRWSDQALDVVPGDTQVVRARGLEGRAVKARFLGDGTA